MKINTKRNIALLTGGIFAISAIVLPAAHAAESKKGKQLKTGAAILGVLGAYFAVKGKTVPAVVAGAGAYYAYKKSKDERNEYSYHDNNDDRYAQRTSQHANEDARYEDVNNNDVLSRENRGDNNQDYDNDDLGYDALTTKSSAIQQAADTKVVEKTSRTKTIVID